MKIRTGTSKDLPFLERMVYEAFFWDPQMTRPDFPEFRKTGDFRRIVEDWGREGDAFFIAEQRRLPVGAIWCRLWSSLNNTSGYISPAIPELGLAVHHRHRSCGIGRRLLRQLLQYASGAEYKAISLSVDPANFSLKLYVSEGFFKVKESGTSWTMMCLL